jgi:5-methylcytosine-specific restriction endonuclease McrA
MGAQVACTCEQCGQTFSDYLSNRSRFCSRACYLASRAVNHPHTCKTCGRTFSSTQSGTKAEQAQFCSRTCAQAPNRVGEQRSCEVCGALFYAKAARVKAGGARFCSNPCRLRGQSEWMKGRGTVEKIQRTCAVCARAFQVYPSRLQWGGAKYCSQRCGGLAKQGRPLARRRPPTIRSCQECQADFVLPRGTLGKAQRFCSTQCYYTHLRRTGERRLPTISIVCQQCKQRRSYHGERRYNAKFCSHTCYVAYKRAHPEEHWMYQGGREYRYGTDWPQKAEAARRRDNYTCRRCGVEQRRPRLDVHHIRPRREFDGDLEAANALDNLVTYCRPCHTTVDARWGKRGPTRRRARQ